MPRDTGNSEAEQTANEHLPIATEDFAGRKKESTPVSLFSGTEEVLSQHALLCDLASSYGLTGELDQLPYTVLEGAERGKRPYLVLFPSREGQPGAAALFHTYEIAGTSTRCFMPIDFAGAMNVIAPKSRRKAIAIQAARRLFRRGAPMVLTSVVGEDFEHEAAELGKKMVCADQVRPIQQKLLMKETYDETLATLGAHTRRNLRYYSKRAAAELGATFTVNGPVSAAEFLELNRQSLWAASESLARWRFMNSRSFEGSFVAALRDRNGRCLSLLGGRNLGESADIDWQMNQSNLASYSLSTVMRSHVMEYLIGQGTRIMRFEGGTPHSIKFAFQEERVGDLLITRRLLGQSFFRRVVAGMLPHDNRFANVFRYDLMKWHE